MKKLYKIVSPGIFPFSICFFLGVFIFFYNIFNLPSPGELTIIIEKWFNQYGLWLLLFAAFIEGVFVVGMYFPGSLVIALSVYTLGKTPFDLFCIGGISYVAFLIANIVNYYLGKFGYYKVLLLIGQKNMINKMHETMSKHGSRTFFITGIFPNFFAITSVCAGISNLKISKTILFQAMSLLFWITTWTITGSLIIKKINLQDNNQSLYLLIIIFLWGVFLIIKENIKSKRKRR